MAAPREVRIFLRHEGQDRKLAKVAFVKRGSNNYITPYGVDGATYYFGQQRMGRGQRTREWEFTGQYRSAATHIVPPDRLWYWVGSRWTSWE